ncbi:MAG: hypothetical protein V7K40_01450, partial [Nostoc sp.]
MINNIHLMPDAIINSNANNDPKVYFAFLGAIALRKYVRTLFECGIDTITKAIKFMPTLPHP